MSPQITVVWGGQPAEPQDPHIPIGLLGSAGALQYIMGQPLSEDALASWMRREGRDARVVYLTLCVYEDRETIGSLLRALNCVKSAFRRSGLEGVDLVIRIGTDRM